MQTIRPNCDLLIISAYTPAQNFTEIS